MSRVLPIEIRRGFTLIELLVVIAIIGLLASIILASLGTARSKGRDARRVSDIREIQNALELYVETCGSFPDISPLTLSDHNGCPAGTTLQSVLPSLPKDPSGGGPGATAQADYPYTAYGSAASCNTYHLGAILETTVIKGVGQASKGVSGSYCTNGKYAGSGWAGGNNDAGNGKDALSSTAGDFSGATTLTNGSYVYDVVP